TVKATVVPRVAAPRVTGPGPTIPKTMVHYFQRQGAQLRSIKAPALETSKEVEAAPTQSVSAKLGDMTVEQLARAIAANKAMGMPSCILKQLQDALDTKVEENRQNEDPSKLLEHLTTMQHNMRKRRDATKAEAEELQRKLDAINSSVADLDHDLAVLQQNIADLVAKQAGTGLQPTKRGGEAPAGFRFLKEALDAPDAMLATPEYLLYKAAQEAQGGAVLCPLCWCLYKALGPLDDDSAGQASKRQCTAAGANGDRMVDDNL
uniref:hypothetical protein n=1 Tax=Limnohabitans sp. TaxID=1907725 RepID=UPI0033418B45